VERQIEYGGSAACRGVFRNRATTRSTAALNYQYRAFGVPGLGLKTGLAEDLVIAPYASVLALMVAPEQACSNLQRLAEEGMAGPYGFFEAVDYTPARLPRGQSGVIVRSFMAHHQGMSLLAFAYLLLDRPMQKRFESDLLFQATMLLLQERIPKATAFYAHTAELSDIHTTPSDTEVPVRLLTGPDTPVPEVQLLSNGRYHVMVTNAGGGYSRGRTAPSPAGAKDAPATTGARSATSATWRAACSGRQRISPRSSGRTYEAIFLEGRAEFRRRDNEIDTHTEIVVSPEDDIELRRVRITNRSRAGARSRSRATPKSSWSRAIADALHPAFSNLFVQTEIIRERHAILCTRPAAARAGSSRRRGCCT
jgi:hypothetical protein